MKISKYWKGVVAGLSPVLIAIQSAVTDDQITSSEWVAIGIAVLTAVGVISVPNRQPVPSDVVPGYSQEKTR